MSLKGLTYTKNQQQPEETCVEEPPVEKPAPSQDDRLQSNALQADTLIDEPRSEPAGVDSPSDNPARQEDDGDMKRGILQIRQSKTETGVRTIELSDSLVAELQQHQKHQSQEREARGEDWREHGLVFPSEVGTPLSPRNLVRHFKNGLERAGLPDTIRFHDLRHSCASFLLAKGEHMKTVSDLLGHSQIYVTMNTYSHVMPGGQLDHLLKK